MRQVTVSGACVNRRYPRLAYNYVRQLVKQENLKVERSFQVLPINFSVYMPALMCVYLSFFLSFSKSSWCLELGPDLIVNFRKLEFAGKSDLNKYVNGCATYNK